MTDTTSIERATTAANEIIDYFESRGRPTMDAVRDILIKHLTPTKAEGTGDLAQLQSDLKAAREEVQAFKKLAEDSAATTREAIKYRDDEFQLRDATASALATERERVKAHEQTIASLRAKVEEQGKVIEQAGAGKEGRP
jgi:septal ring factor EnvC (AmiA/AmiB activator)